MKSLRAGVLAAAIACGLGGAPSGPADCIVFELNSWGRLLERWTINADGSGELIATRNNPEGGLAEGGGTIQRLGPDPARFRRLSSLLQPALPYAGRDLPCGEKTFDLPYGEVSWRHPGAAHALRFDTGCNSAAARRVLASLRAANDLVGQWMAAAPKVEAGG